MNVTPEEQRIIESWKHDYAQHIQRYAVQYGAHPEEAEARRQEILTKPVSQLVKTRWHGLIRLLQEAYTADLMKRLGVEEGEKLE